VLISFSVHCVVSKSLAGLRTLVPIAAASFFRSLLHETTAVQLVRHFSHPRCASTLLQMTYVSYLRHAKTKTEPA